MSLGASFETTEITPSAPSATAGQRQGVVTGQDGEALGPSLDDRRELLRRSRRPRLTADDPGISASDSVCSTPRF